MSDDLPDTTNPLVKVTRDLREIERMADEHVQGNVVILPQSVVIEPTTVLNSLWYLQATSSKAASLKGYNCSGPTGWHHELMF